MIGNVLQFFQGNSRIQASFILDKGRIVVEHCERRGEPATEHRAAAAIGDAEIKLVRAVEAALHDYYGGRENS